MVQTAEDANVVLNAGVILHLSQTGETEITLAATRAQATNKLLYAARPALPSAGVWRLKVDVKTTKNTSEASGEITVLGPEEDWRTYWLYFAIVPAGVSLFAISQWLKSIRRL